MNTVPPPPAPSHAPPQQDLDGNGKGPDDHGHAAHGDGDHGHGDKAAIHDLPTDLPRPSGFVVAMVGLGAVLLLAAMFLIGYIPHHHEQAEIDKAAEAIANATPVVELAPLKQSAPESDLMLPVNNVQAWQQTALYPRITGYIHSWTYDIGSHVNKNAVLAVIAAPDVDAQLRQAQANLEQGKAAVEKATADVTIAKNTYDRYQQWMNTTAGVSKQDLEDRLNQYQDAVAVEHQAEANVDSLNAAVQQLQVAQGFETIYAPFTGVVTTRNYDVGALMTANNASAKEMFDMQETDKLRVFINVPQIYASSMSPGTTPAYLTVKNYPGHEFQGIVARTAGAVDPSSRTMTVEVDILKNPDNMLSPGMYGTIRLPVSQPHPSLIMPTSALIFDAATPQLRVAVVKDGTVHFTEIKVGRDYGTTIEVTDGLSPTDQVIDNPGQQVADGSKVQVQGSDQPPQGGTPNPKLARAN